MSRPMSASKAVWFVLPMMLGKCTHTQPVSKEVLKDKVSYGQEIKVVRPNGSWTMGNLIQWSGDSLVLAEKYTGHVERFPGGSVREVHRLNRSRGGIDGVKGAASVLSVIQAGYFVYLESQNDLDYVSDAGMALFLGLTNGAIIGAVLGYPFGALHGSTEIFQLYDSSTQDTSDVGKIVNRGEVSKPSDVGGVRGP